MFVNAEKYSKDAPFEDPVVRCESCQTLLFRNRLKEFGKCYSCGARKVRNVDMLSGEENRQMREAGVDPAFLKLFEEVKE
jgi:hypothetical protein